jgi:putative aldouronate transport system permease protein
MKNRYNNNIGSLIFDCFNAVFMLGLIIIMFYPLYFIFITSISNGMVVMQGRVSFFPVQTTLDTYKILVGNKQIFNSMKNSFIYTASGTGLSLLLSCLCAYPLSRRTFSGRKVLTGFVVFTMFFSGGMIPLYLVINSLKMMDTIWAVILPVSINTYNMIIIRTAFQSVPESMIESAQLDGANDFTILFRFVIPVSKAVLATMLLFYAVSYWNSYFNEMLYLNSRSKYPMQIILRNMLISGLFSEESTTSGGASSFTVSDATLRSAVIVITTLPILVVYPFVQRYFVKGVMIGSLKG